MLRLLRGRAGGGRGRLRDGATTVPRSLRSPPPLRNRVLRGQPLRASAAPPAGRVHPPAGPRLAWDRPGALPREPRPVGGSQRRAWLWRQLSEDPAASVTPGGPVTPTMGRTKKTLQEAGCTDLGKQPPMEHSEGTRLWPRLGSRPGSRPGGEAGPHPGAPALGLALREPQALQAEQPQTPVLVEVSPRLHGPTRTRETRVGRGRASR